MANYWDNVENLYTEKYGDIKEYKQEISSLKKVLEKISKHLENQYDFIKPMGIGGSAIVIKIRDKKINLDMAIKVPRPKKEINDLIDSFRSEIKYLNKVRHRNIISIYNFGNVDVEGFNFSYPYFVMDYIKEAKDITKKIVDILESATKKDVKNIMKFVIDKFYEIANAIRFLHEKHNIIHFDIKPSNILINKNNEPILTDLGFAREKSNKKTPQTVGFTHYYAHPNLKKEYYYMSSKDRVRKRISPKDFEYSWDIYAFGKSLLEILSLIDMYFGHLIVYDYSFIYEHLSACRMLDGKNLHNEEIENIKSEQNKKGYKPLAFYETWGKLDRTDFSGIKYEKFEDICEDFEKLQRGKEYLSESVPELDIYYPKRVQSSEGIPAPFSNRVKYIAEHPVFSRLMHVSQLGLLNYVYPTATHNRLEHSIGTFRNCCLYVQSLWNDSYNPLFKQLVTEQDIKCVLLASLLHDLGQYPLAHEIGEIAKEFRHEKFTVEFLDNPTKDKFGYTLQDIIKNEKWGWGVLLENVKKTLEETRKQKGLYKNIKSQILSSIIDSPIDADKLDYLLRDGQNCYLKYGNSIDVDRLIRNLTIIITKDKDITIGTYEKGQTAAESLSFSRYLMYQSVYWHHTARAIRAMLREAIEAALKEDKKGKYKTFYNELKGLLGITKQPANITTSDILNLIEKWTDTDGKEMIGLIKQRDYYKRILTIHNDSPPFGEGQENLLGKFRKNYKKPKFQETLQQKIRTAFVNQISGEHPKTSSLTSAKTNKTNEILATPKKIICDCPKPIYGTEKILEFIPEPQRLQRNYLTKANMEERVSEMWNIVYYKLMNIVSKGRVFCHPEIRDTLMTALGPENIKTNVEEVIERFS